MTIDEQALIAEPVAHVPAAERTTPTPITISRRAAIVGLIALVVGAVLLFRAAPSVPLVAIGGLALALVLSFPVRALSRIMPRALAITLTMLVLIGLIAVALVILVPILIDQFSSLIQSIPAIAGWLNDVAQQLLRPLVERNLIPNSPEELATPLETLLDRVQALGERLLMSAADIITSVFAVAVRIFGIVFVAVYLLVDVDRIKATYLSLAPQHYRHDALELWNAFGVSLSRYLAGLAFTLTIQGVLSTTALWVLGVPYALVLGAWVSVTALIPYLGAWLGAIPAVIVAAFQSPTTAVLTAGAYLVIQQLDSNFLTPRIQGQAVRVHPILVLLAVLGGGELLGPLGAIIAVPTLAVLRVFFDFFRVRLRVQS